MRRVPAAERPCPRALLVQAREMDDAWNAMAEHEDQERAEQAILALRQVLAGTRRLYSRTDSWGYLRMRCACRWVGSPWTDGDRYAGNFLTARQQADAEYAGHVCNLIEEI